MTQTHAVEVLDIQVPGCGPAYVVRPRVANDAAGVLFLHWLEPPSASQNRTEFLADAIDLAQRGVVSLLPDLVFPWNRNVTGDQRDVTSVLAQLDAVRRAYAEVAAQPGVDPDRIAVVGHDYGGMFGTLLVESEPAITTQVLMAADATWANWFATYFRDVADYPEYADGFAGLDPVDNVGRVGDGLYIQWAGDDRFVPSEIHNRFRAANPLAKVSLYPKCKHSLDDLAVRADRLAWLTERLNL